MPIFNLITTFILSSGGCLYKALLDRSLTVIRAKDGLKNCEVRGLKVHSTFDDGPAKDPLFTLTNFAEI